MSASRRISSNSKKKSSDVLCPCLIVQSFLLASSNKWGLPKVSRKRISKASQDCKEKRPSLTSWSSNFLQFEAPPVRKVKAYRMRDSAVGNDEGCESKIFSKELRKFSESLIDPSKVGGSAIRALGPVLWVESRESKE